MKLPAYSRYKPSGVEWLGDVPEHWEVTRLSYVASLKSGENITSEMIAEGGEYPVYGGNGRRGHYHKFTHRGHYALIGRQGALCGNINYASGKFWASEHALVVSPLKEFALVWMGELLRAMNLGRIFGQRRAAWHRCRNDTWSSDSRSTLPGATSHRGFSGSGEPAIGSFGGKTA